jgi:triphosphoribosyl-dephospho-CoA synthase
MMHIGAAAQLACLLEVSAPKPGNVSPGRGFADTRYEDFLASAAAIGGPLSGADTRGVGATIRLAIDETSAWTRSNTNLGIVLLLAPLARAASLLAGNTPLRDSVRAVLDATTVDDARDVYAAIRLAAPGGLGQAASQDVADEPTVTLLDAMRLAADRDTIAREYSSAFELTFDVAAPAITRARCDRLSWDDAVVEAYLTLLAAVPDTHIARRGGAALAADVSRRAADVLAAGGVRSAPGRREIEALDRALRDGSNLANPGTTADVTAAAIFVVLINGGWDAAR